MKDPEYSILFWKRRTKKEASDFLISSYVIKLQKSKHYGTGVINRHIDQWNIIETKSKFMNIAK